MSLLQKKSNERVVVTGLGAVSAIGDSMPQTWENLLYSRSHSAEKIKRFNADGYKTRIAFEGPELSFDLVSDKISEESPLTRKEIYGLHSCLEALKHAGIDAVTTKPLRKGVMLGVGMGTPDMGVLDRYFQNGELSSADAKLQAAKDPQRLATLIAEYTDARHQCGSIHTACASSTQAMGEAFELIRSGELDMAVTGGADAMTEPLQVAGLSLLGALSTRNDSPETASRPFDADRDGFVVGDGACILIFESLSSAKKRGAPILAEVCGYGITENGYRITDLHPDGLGIKEAMQMALDDAGVKPKDVEYINAHGTSTLPNDLVESQALAAIFSGSRPYVSSTKSMVGHMIAAAGAIEFGFCVKALEEGKLPPSRNVANLDPAIDINLTPQGVLELPVECVMSSSIGFGGSNAMLIARRFHD